MLIKYQDAHLLYETFRVVAKDSTDKSYFVIHSQHKQTDKYYWCRANISLKLGEVVKGYLCPSDNFNNKMPTLIIGECYAIIPAAC